MALFRCNKCGHIREVGNDYIGKSANCPKCDQITPIYDTTAFVKALILKHISLNSQFQKLRQKFPNENDIVECDSIEEIDIYNTKALTQADRYESILQWFEKRNIQVLSTMRPSTQRVSLMK